jgi:hypothetical protein
MLKHKSMSGGPGVGSSNLPAPTISSKQAQGRTRARSSPPMVLLFEADSCGSPESTACADGHGYQAEREIDRHDAADLLELLGSFGEGSPFNSNAKTAPRRKEQMQEQQHHHEARALHDVDMRWGAGEPAESVEQHAVAADEEKADARPHPREEAAQHTMPKRESRRRLKRPHGFAQHHIGKEHPADPDDGGNDVEHYEHCHAPRLS